jgi:RNA polymerase sigma factor (sigma-70 family)
MSNDNELIKNIKNDVDADFNLKELVNRHSGIFLSMIHNYIPNSSSVINKSDLIQDRDYYIYKAALKFDEDRLAKFSTFLGNETKWMCLNLYNKNKNKSSIEYNESTAPSPDEPSELEDSINRDIFDNVISFARKHPDKRVETIFKMRYIEGYKNGVMPWRTISEELNMSIQGCINIHNAALKIFKNKISKEDNNYVK